MGEVEYFLIGLIPSLLILIGAFIFGYFVGKGEPKNN